MKKIIFLLLLSSAGMAERVGGFASMPGGIIAPDPVGFVFPGFNSAAGVNPAALAIGKKNTAFQALYAPPLVTGDPTTYFASVAASVKNTGWSIGYVGTDTGAGLTHGMFAGVGFKLNKVSLGVGLRSSAFVNGFNPNVDLGGEIKLGNNFVLSALAYSVDSAVQPGVGLGYGKPKQDNVELSFLMGAPGSTNHRVTFGASLFVGKIGALFQTNYYLGTRSFIHNLGMLFQVSESLNFLAELTTPRTMRFGLTLSF